MGKIKKEKKNKMYEEFEKMDKEELVEKFADIVLDVLGGYGDGADWEGAKYEAIKKELLKRLDK